MASLNVNTPDGKTLTVQVPAGFDSSKYGELADDALAHYQSVNAPSEGTLGSFLRGVGNNLPLGPQAAALLSPGKYSDNLAADNAATERDKAQNPVAYGAGAVGGTLAPAAIPGVGELMAANPVTSGAILGGANAISNTDLKQNLVQGAGQAAMGAATGGLLSGLIAKIAPPVQASLESKANTLANKSINMPAGILVDMTPEEQQAQGEFLRTADLVGKNKGPILDKAKDILDEYGSKIGTLGQDLTKKGLTVDDAGMMTQPLVDKALQFESLENPEANSLFKGYMAGAKDINSLGKNPSWSQIQNLKQTYGGLAFKSTGEIKNQAAADTYFVLKDALKGIAQKAQGNPNVPTEYQQALAGYSRMSPIVSGLEKSVDADLRGASGSGGVGFHPMRMLAAMPGPVRAIGGTIAAATGHPLLATAAALPEVMNPALQSKAAGAAANAVPSISSGLQRLVTQAMTNPQMQAKVQDLIKQLKDKYDQRRKF